MLKLFNFLILFSLFSFISCLITLQPYNIQNKIATVSGISSGGYMAVQVHIAFSSFINGSGIFAGGPYHCAEGSLSTATYSCMKATIPIDISKLVQYTKDQTKKGTIDSYNNLYYHKVYLFSGEVDSVVSPKVMSSLNDYYLSFIPSSNIVPVFNINAEHTYPTLSDGNPCTTLKSPYVGKCSYDGAGYTLTTLYSDIKTRGTEVSSNLFEFDQTPYFTGRISVSKSGYIYIPTSCSQNTACHLHVAFHGCEQGYEFVKLDFITKSGYNSWAENNNVIVVYPQAMSDQVLGNPNGCWDWWGYTGITDYTLKKGAQMQFIEKIIKALIK